jgi:hypothetical protein
MISTVASVIERFGRASAFSEVFYGFRQTLLLLYHDPTMCCVAGPSAHI